MRQKIKIAKEIKSENFPNLMKSANLHIQGVAWFLLVAFGKMQKEGDKLKKEPLNKKEPELDDLVHPYCKR